MGLRLIVCALVCSIGFAASAANLDLFEQRRKFGLLSGCIDCFNFVAPSVLGAESVSPAEIGLIVYDSTYKQFRGYNQDGVWTRLSSERSIRSLTSAATLLNVDDLVLTNATSGAFTVTLPPAASCAGKELTIKKTDSSINKITLDGNASETIDGVANKKLITQNESIRIVSDGTGWQVTDRRIPSVWNAYTPTLTSSGGGAVTLNATSKLDPWGRWRRVGETIELHVGFKNGTGGGATGAAGGIKMSLPSGVEGDFGSSSVSNTAFGSYLGSGFSSGSASTMSTFFIYGGSDISFGFGAAYLTVANLAAGLVVNGHAKFKVTDWED